MNARDKAAIKTFTLYIIIPAPPIIISFGSVSCAKLYNFYNRGYNYRQENIPLEVISSLAFVFYIFFPLVSTELPGKGYVHHIQFCVI